ncbi:MAG: glycosyltransferase [Planctomycetota bacterium]
MPTSRSAAPDRPLRVAYILKRFPRLSETFILNELLALESQGVEASVFSLYYPDDGRFHGRLAQLRLTARYLVQDKLEGYWTTIGQYPSEFTPRISSWQAAADFLARWKIPKDLDLLLRAVQLSAELRQAGVEHVHAHFATVATHVAALVHLLTGIPFSFTAHAKDIFRDTVNRPLYSELVRLSAFNITVSDYNRAFLLEHMPGIDANKVIRLYNGIDLSYFDSVPGNVARGPAIPHIVSVGRLVPKKGFDHLLRALAMWKREGGRFTTTIVGDGEDRAALVELCRTLALESDVTFTGALPQEEVRRYYQTASVVALACVADEIGNQDALPTTLLESLACDVPVVSTRIAGVPEIVGLDGGAVVEPADDAAFARALAETARKRLGGEFAPGVRRARALRLFDLSVSAATLRSHFLQSARSPA